MMKYDNSFFILICLILWLQILGIDMYHYVDYHLAESENLKFSVAITTIPPRFKHILPTVLSWLDQAYPPDRICIYIPQAYKRFRRKDSSIVNNFNLLKTHLMNSSKIVTSLTNGQLKIVTISEDWGPITRFVGVLFEQRVFENENHPNRKNQDSCYNLQDEFPHFWIFSDDDVTYNRFTILKYHYYLTNYCDFNPLLRKYPHIVLTQFVETYRIFYYLLAHEKGSRIIPRHLQGVDTYVIPSSILLDQFYEHSLLHFETAAEIIRSFHQTYCPESFYQDDYIVSFLLSLANISVLSIWNSDKLTGHLDDISLHNFQMHRDILVFDREEATKSCIYSFAPSIYAKFIVRNLLVT